MAFKERGLLRFENVAGEEEASAYFLVDPFVVDGAGRGGGFAGGDLFDGV